MAGGRHERRRLAGLLKAKTEEIHRHQDFDGVQA